MPAPSRFRLFDGTGKYVDRFGVLLVLTIGAVGTLSLSGGDESTDLVSGHIRAAVVTVLVGLTFLLSLRASGVARRWVRIADIAIGAAVTLTVVLILLSLVPDVDTDVHTTAVVPVLWLVLAVLSPIAVVRRLLQQREVTAETLMGSISAYLLIPVAYYYVFVSIEALQGDFFGVPVRRTSYMYFSLENLTTLGYGDLTPKTDLARLLATSEAVIGQVFLVTFVAVLVGRFASRSIRGTGANEL